MEAMCATASRTGVREQKHEVGVREQKHEVAIGVREQKHVQ